MIDVRVIKAPICNVTGAIISTQGIFLEVTERRQAEEALRKSEEHLRQILTQAPIGIALTAPDGQLMQVNQAFCQQMLGYTEAPLMTLSFAEFIHPEDLVIHLPWSPNYNKYSKLTAFYFIGCCLVKERLSRKRWWRDGRGRWYMN
jgi:PAS domain-containing protein